MVGEAAMLQFSDIGKIMYAKAIIQKFREHWVITTVVTIAALIIGVSELVKSVKDLKDIVESDSLHNRLAKNRLINILSLTAYDSYHQDNVKNIELSISSVSYDINNGQFDIRLENHTNRSLSVTEMQFAIAYLPECGGGFIETDEIDAQAEMENIDIDNFGCSEVVLLNEGYGVAYKIDANDSDRILLNLEIRYPNNISDVAGGFHFFWAFKYGSNKMVYKWSPLACYIPFPETGEIWDCN